jgi:hypothetical protein
MILLIETIISVYRMLKSELKRERYAQNKIQVHGSTVDRPLKTKGYVISAVHARSHGPGLLQATGGGEHAGVRRRAAGARRRCPWVAFPATIPPTNRCKMKRGHLRT